MPVLSVDRSMAMVLMINFLLVCHHAWPCAKAWGLNCNLKFGRPLCTLGRTPCRKCDKVKNRLFIGIKKNIYHTHAQREGKYPFVLMVSISGQTDENSRLLSESSYQIIITFFPSPNLSNCRLIDIPSACFFLRIKPVDWRDYLGFWVFTV